MANSGILPLTDEEIKRRIEELEQRAAALEARPR